MEPITELALRIFQYLWLLHEWRPKEGNPKELLTAEWLAYIQACASKDYSVAARLLELAAAADEDSSGLSAESATPLRRWERLFGWAKISGYRTRKKAHTDRRPARSIDEAIEEIYRRLQKLIDEFNAPGRPGSVNFFVPRMLSGKAMFRSSQADARLLTREELVERIANFLAGLDEKSLAKIAAIVVKSRELLSMAAAINRETEPETLQRRITANAECGESKERREQALIDWKRNPAAILFNRSKLRTFCKDLGIAVPFSLVLSDELDEIHRLRLARLNPTPEPLPDDRHLPTQQAFDRCLFGLALSGGGIRSATFGLGLLQGMADRNMLPWIDILSTVSGGGYIGSWLISWIKRTQGGVHAVQWSLRGNASSLQLGPACPPRRPLDAGPDLADAGLALSRNIDPRAEHIRPVRLLRQYARYLAPKEGVFSADSWTIFSTWFRNTFLNLLILIPLLAVFLLAPRVIAYTMLHLRLLRPLTDNAAGAFLSVLLFGTPFFHACYNIGKNNSGSDSEGGIASGFDDTKVLRHILLWAVLGAALEVTALWTLGAARHPFLASFGMAVVTGIAVQALQWASPKPGTAATGASSRRIWRIVVLVSALAAGAFMYGLCSFMGTAGQDTERGIWIVVTVGVPLMLSIVGTIVILLLGVAGNALSDEQREWWSRLGAWMTMSIAVWLSICAMSFFAPLWIAMLGRRLTAIGVGGWLGITGAGARFAFAPESGRDGESAQGRIKGLVMNAAPWVFVVGLLSAISFGLFWAINRSLWWLALAPWGIGNLFLEHPLLQVLCCVNLPIGWQWMLNHYWALMYPGSPIILVLALLLAWVSHRLAGRVDVNQFSMHHFYRNRLVRAYLGSSRLRAHRSPDAFTGFDPGDDINLYRFRSLDPGIASDEKSDCKQSYVGPYPILNTALNTTSGADLGIQERKAESFVFTPLWSGFDFSRRQFLVKKSLMSEFAFRRTELCGDAANCGVLLGTAMAVSGAAFNANAGFHTSPGLAFLLTVFGVRLGLWVGNPRGSQWQKPSPDNALSSLFRELRASTGDDRDFVLLSDGGHFENMGLYELIRRRCRYIVVSDAEEDEKFKLEGIGGAIRKCRDDFGVVIDLNLETLEPLGDPGESKLHYSMGTIIYPGEAECGKLVYIKSSVTGDEPVDVIEFRKRHPEFPHTSTVDQFFDESHFESYRALGHHAAYGVFTQNMPATPSPTGISQSGAMADLFRRIESDWTKRRDWLEKSGKKDR